MNSQNKIVNNKSSKVIRPLSLNEYLLKDPMKIWVLKILKSKFEYSSYSDNHKDTEKMLYAR